MKYDNLPRGASDDFKDAYDYGYAAAKERTGGDVVDFPSPWPDGSDRVPNWSDLHKGFEAGVRQAKNDEYHPETLKHIYQWGCLLGFWFVVIPYFFFHWHLGLCLGVAVALWSLSCYLHKVFVKRHKKEILADKEFGEKKTGCGCMIAILLMVLALFNEWPFQAVFLIGVGISVLGMVLDAYT